MLYYLSVCFDVPLRAEAFAIISTEIVAESGFPTVPQGFIGLAVWVTLHRGYYAAWTGRFGDTAARLRGSLDWGPDRRDII